MASASSVNAAGLTLVRPDPCDSQETAPCERRLHPRSTLSDLDWLDTVRLKYGPVVSLIDLSPGGVQIETTARLHPGAVVVVQISGAGGEVAMPSTVLRSHVSRLAPYAMYRAALAFKRTFEAPQATPERSSDPFANLVSEHARMTGAMRRLSHACAGGNPAALAGDEILTSTLALIQSPAGHRAGDGFRRHLTQLFRELTRGIESATPADDLLAMLAERLRRSVPTRIVRIVDGAMPIGPHGPDTIFFDGSRNGVTLARLVVEFPGDCQLEEWHLHYLRIAAQLVALVTEVAELRERAVPIETPAEPTAAVVETPAPPLAAVAVAPAPAAVVENAVPPGNVWVKVVARYADGRVLKGHCRGFAAARGCLSVSPAPDAPQSAATTVLLRQLKAVFFVHDLDGAPVDLDATPTARGRDIVVTFMDGEVTSGTTLNYAADSAGFYLSPHDQRGNNLRIFVINEAVRHVQFP